MLERSTFELWLIIWSQKDYSLIHLVWSDFFRLTKFNEHIASYKAAVKSYVNIGGKIIDIKLLVL